MTDVQLIETMQWNAETGITRLALHLTRLQRSARRLGFAGAEKAEERLAALAGNGHTDLRVRLTLSKGGDIDITTAGFAPLPPDTLWTVRVARTRLSSTDPMLRYKTTRRDHYDAARKEFSATEADEVLMLNEKAEPCEGTITSLFLDDGSGVLKTPPIACGLLAGVLRTQMICQRKARVQRVTLGDLQNGTLYVGNSLRGLIRARLAG